MLKKCVSVFVLAAFLSATLASQGYCLSTTGASLAGHRQASTAEARLQFRFYLVGAMACMLSDAIQSAPGLSAGLRSAAADLRQTVGAVRSGGNISQEVLAALLGQAAALIEAAAIEPALSAKGADLAPSLQALRSAEI